MSGDLSRALERFYEIYTWTDDISSEEGWRRFNRELEWFRKLVQHKWVEDVIGSKDRIVVVDLCGGGGFGGIGLAKVLTESRGVDVDLMVVDLRRKALEKALENSRRILGFEARTVYADVTRLYKTQPQLRADIALLHGLTTPHFDPWDMIRLAASTAKILQENGVFVVDEVDRVYKVFYQIGYKEVLTESTGDRVVLGIHLGYDPRRGMFKRLVYDLETNEKARLDAYFWNIAGVAAILWVFFRDVDFVELGSSIRGFILAKTPRNNIDPVVFEEDPSILSKQ